MSPYHIRGIASHHCSTSSNRKLERCVTSARQTEPALAAVQAPLVADAQTVKVQVHLLTKTVRSYMCLYLSPSSAQHADSIYERECAYANNCVIIFSLFYLFFLWVFNISFKHCIELHDPNQSHCTDHQATSSCKPLKQDQRFNALQDACRSFEPWPSLNTSKTCWRLMLHGIEAVHFIIRKRSFVNANYSCGCRGTIYKRPYLILHVEWQ